MSETKKCITCEKVLPLESFHIRADNGRHTGTCKDCKIERSKKHYRDNTKRHHATVKRRYDTFGRFRRYGLTVEQYDAALAAQGRRCALCFAPKPGGKGKWHIDHCHEVAKSTGFNQCAAGDSSAFRGLLCHRCNVALGHYEKLVSRVGLDAVAAYLSKLGGLDGNHPPANRTVST